VLLACLLAGCTNNADPSTSANGALPPAPAGLSGPVDAALRAKFPAAIQASGILRLAADPTYPPSTFKDDTGAIVGLMPDLATAISSRAGLRVTWVQVPFDGMLAGLGAHRFDASWSGWSTSAEREQQLNLVAFSRAGTSVLVKAGNPAGIRTTTDLCGHTVAAQTGTTQAQQIADGLQRACAGAGKPAVTLLQLPQQTDVSQAVATGRAEALLADSVLVGYQAQIRPGTFEAVPAILLQPTLGSVAVPKDDPQLAAALAAAFDAIMADGTYAKILARWNDSNAALTEAAVNPESR